MSDAPFLDPPWNAELDVPAALAVITPDAALSGMFFLALVDGAKRRNVTLAGARERYLPFGFYPIAEFAPLLLAAARLFYPTRSLRHALRALGHAGPAAFLGSTLGKVTLGSAVGVQGAIEAFAKTYALNVRPSQCSVKRATAASCVVELRNVQYFLDSHHVGAFEGILDYAAVKGLVRIAALSPVSADLLVEWG